MAKTYRKATLNVFCPNDAMLAVVPVYLPEAASQTFLKGSPVVFSSGYIAVGTDPVTTCHGFSISDAHNSTAGAYEIMVIPAAPGNFVHLHGNLLTTAAADHTLVATNLGVAYQINYEATGGSAGEAIWHFGATGSSQGAKIVSFRHDPAFIVDGNAETRAYAGDTNARVTAVLLDSAADYAVA